MSAAPAAASSSPSPSPSASSSSSSDRRLSSSSWASSRPYNGRNASEPTAKNANLDASLGRLESPLFDPMTVCDFIEVPPTYEAPFAYLHGTQLFFFDVLRKLNRLRHKDKRVCFVTDYTINLASPVSGHVSRCSKIEDVEELICDPQRRAVGIRMRDRPFAVKPHDFIHWNCFFDMPVDLLLFMRSKKQLADLLRVLRYVYHQCTNEDVACRYLEPAESWEATLVLVPDGSRVKKRAMLYHRMPVYPRDRRGGRGTEEGEAAGAAVPAEPLAPSSPAAGAAAVASDHAVSASRTSPTNRRASSQQNSPPPRPPKRRSLSRPVGSPRRFVAEQPLSTPAGKQLLPSQSARETNAAASVSNGVTPMSSTRRTRNPLLGDVPTSREKDHGRNWTTVTAQQSLSSRMQARSSADHARGNGAAGKKQHSDQSLLHSPASAPEEALTARDKVNTLEEMVQEQQRCIRELRQSRYSKECELDDLKRHLCSRNSLSNGGANTSHRLQRQPQAPAARSEKKNGPRVSSPPILTYTASSPAKWRVRTPAPSTVHSRQGTPLPAPLAKGADTASAVATREAKEKLEEALRRHRRFEKAVWAYYKELPTSLQEKITAYQHCDSALQRRQDGGAASPRRQRRTTERELQYLHQLVEENERARAQALQCADSSIQIEESLTVVGDQIDAFAEELARKQVEIDVLRRQLRSKGGESR